MQCLVQDLLLYFEQEMWNQFLIGYVPGRISLVWNSLKDANLANIAVICGAVTKIVAVFISGVRWSCLNWPFFFAFSHFNILFPRRNSIHFLFLTVNLDCLSTVALCIIALLLIATDSKGSAWFWVGISFCLSGFPTPNLHLSSLQRQIKFEEKIGVFIGKVMRHGSRRARLEENKGM